MCRKSLENCSLIGAVVFFVECQPGKKMLFRVERDLLSFVFQMQQFFKFLKKAFYPQ